MERREIDVRILITGSQGFIGRNLITQLQKQTDHEILRYDIDNSPEDLENYLQQADIIYHLAGINRPETVDEFKSVNVGLSKRICEIIKKLNKSSPIIFSSSTQAEMDNPYGKSKKEAEDVLKEYAIDCQSRVIIYRLSNVFGKWSRPNYNSVVATFCHNITHDLPISISNPTNVVKLIYIDDVVVSMINELQSLSGTETVYRTVEPIYPVTLEHLSELIYSFRAIRDTLVLPQFTDEFIYKLYGTYITYLGEGDFAYTLGQHCDNRGCLAEFVKSDSFGQIFLSTTKPGVTRGGHYHHTKTEKFLVLQGDAIIRFRQIEGDEIIEYSVSGYEFKVVDIPPGYTHMIENIGQSELITLFWASEPFNQNQPDTIYEPV